MTRLAGKSALITGAARGIGLAFARAYAREGAKVVIGDIDLAVGQAAAREIGEAADAISLDVTSSDSIAAAVRHLETHHGGIDILVNNAGTSAAYPFEQTDDAAWQADLDLKLFGAIRCIRLCLPAMRRAGGGRIINVLNTGAKQPPARSVPTSVSRAAGMALTKALSKELAPDRISVNAICIGLVKSGQWERRWEQRGRPGTLIQFYETLARDSGVPAGRIAEADELAALVAFLVSPHAAYITGVAINFDGGLSGVV